MTIILDTPVELQNVQIYTNTELFTIIFKNTLNIF